ncbi:hypothetical protein D4764_11G0007860 [Takifugu flavidus]|uniref:Uncharacterized protein n=1 Tax=Takifugu flavidus TaxID=433684 RepID=A0A5C6PH47_9TELE|nr:hypothetical protein D4764_11G0007860 [Takifugu flavidus]
MTRHEKRLRIMTAPHLWHKDEGSSILSQESEVRRASRHGGATVRPRVGGATVRPRVGGATVRPRVGGATSVLAWAGPPSILAWAGPPSILAWAGLGPQLLASVQHLAAKTERHERAENCWLNHRSRNTRALALGRPREPERAVEMPRPAAETPHRELAAPRPSDGAVGQFFRGESQQLPNSHLSSRAGGGAGINHPPTHSPLVPGKRRCMETWGQKPCCHERDETSRDERVKPSKEQTGTSWTNDAAEAESKHAADGGARLGRTGGAGEQPALVLPRHRGQQEEHR